MSDAQRRGRTVLGARGMVASAHPMVSLAGASALSSGGNAYDAALAMAGMASVVLPAMCGLGGDAFALVFDGRQRGWTALMGSGFGPDGADVGFFRERGLTAVPIDGPLSVAVPGAVDCWATLHARGATRALADLWEPAIAAARDGIAVSRRLHAEAEEGMGKLQRSAASSSVFLRSGAAPPVGSVLQQPDLARTLHAVASDPSRFYEGALAERCVSALRAGGAPFSGDEWSAQRTLVGTPMRGSYRGMTLHTTLLPSPGFMIVQQAAMLDGLLNSLPRLDADAVHLLASAARRAFDDRVGNAGSDGDTTSFVAADSEGTVISLIQSVAFLWGSGVTVPGTGILLNNRAGRGFYLDESHPNGIRPRRRPMHTLTVWAVSDDSGAPLIAGGTPGGDGQVQWNMQLLSHLLDHGASLQDAVESPRFTVWPGSDADVLGSPPELRCESRLGEATLAGLRARGHNVRVLGPWDGGGGAQLIAVDRGHGTLRGASDPRLDGCAIGI